MYEALNPLDVRPLTKVALKRGLRADSSLMPVISPPLAGDNARATAKARADRGAGKAELDNLELEALMADERSEAQPTGVVLTMPDARRGVNVKWDRDGSWSICQIAQLELVERAPDAPADPISELAELKRQNADLQNKLADLGDIEKRVADQMARTLAAAGAPAHVVEAATESGKQQDPGDSPRV